tara:strand:- start:1062 stop:1712 length:651 start_codon:yes stop_codon:yes gene_type:complete
MNLVRQIIIFFYKLLYLINSYIYVKPVKINHYKEYLDAQSKMFLDKYDASLNKNIEILYDFHKSKEIMNNFDNNLEKIWKMRLLYQSVLLKNNSRVNVMMFYNPYKNGFAYYCDNLVDYQSLNVLAMKYVRYFECMEFFVDEKILSEVNGKSVFLENLKNDKIKSKFKKNVKNKMKDELIKNKFIYLGKISNFEWIKKEKPTVKNIGYSKFKELFN